MLHGWPSSFVEYLAIIPMLAAQGFEVIVPSLPGYGFSEIPSERGMTSEKIAGIMLQLMDALGHERFMIHAHDHGASVTSRLAFFHPDRVLAYHTTEPGIPRPVIGPGTTPLTDDEQAFLDFGRAWNAVDGGYAAVQSTRPQTVAYGLNDSPIGLAAWLLEKWQTWTAPPTGNLFDAIDRDLVLGNLSVYWFTQTVNYGGRAYFDNSHYLEALPDAATIDVPVGVTLVATQGIERVPREYAARRYPDIRYWHELPRGGHFIAGEEPKLLADSITSFAREVGL
jgi:pimeloyl-ACP methyl ester carboxylesterase